MSDLHLVKDAVSDFLGDRCDEFNADCMTCRAWAEIDRIEALEAQIKSQVMDHLTETGQLLDRVASLEAQVATLLGAANQSRLAFGGFVSAQSATDKLDSALSRVAAIRAAAGGSDA